MQVQLFQAPYDSGQRGARMGKGPLAFIERGLAARLRAQGWNVEVETIEAISPFRAEIRTAFELCRALAQHVQQAREQGAFPLILSGNCISSLGGIAGVDPARLGVIWFDAHCDFHTPETTAGGMLDSMGLAVATGHCWTTITQFIPGFAVIPLAGQVQRVYIHLDLDVLDPEVGTANPFATPGGLFVPELEQAITMIARRFVIAGAAFTAYDPDCDPAEAILHAGVHLMEHLVQQVERRQSA